MITEMDTTHEAGCSCTDCVSGKRNRYFRWKSLKSDEFRIEQAYGIERRRLLNRSVVGWGVVRGFSLDQEEKPDPLKFSVGDGFGLDRHGREAVLVSDARLSDKNTFVIELSHGGCHMRSFESVGAEDTHHTHHGYDRLNANYLLKVHYAERHVGDALRSDPCGCDPAEKNFVCETVVFSLTPLHGRCPCAEENCTRTCDCPKENNGGEHCACKGRGPHACLCHWVTDTKELKPTKLCEWNGYWVDPADGIPLGCVRAWKTDDKCWPVGIRVTDACGPRRLVKNNDLLYDLLRGCDLTHIKWISWHDWHRQRDIVEWDKFAAKFHPEGTPDNRPPVKTDFVIRFSGPVLRHTIRRDAVIMTAITRDADTHWQLVRRVPIRRLDTTPTDASAPDGYTDQVQIYVSAGWFNDQMQAGVPSGFGDPFTVIEIEIRGDLILDCKRQQLDANAHGADPSPSGNGSPGGTFMSSFRVGPKPTKHREPVGNW